MKKIFVIKNIVTGTYQGRWTSARGFSKTKLLLNAETYSEASVRENAEYIGKNERFVEIVIAEKRPNTKPRRRKIKA